MVESDSHRFDDDVVEAVDDDDADNDEADDDDEHDGADVDAAILI